LGCKTKTTFPPNQPQIRLSRIVFAGITYL
jgi:hypothetical protein